MSHDPRSLDSNDSGNAPDTFDRLLGALDGLPDVVQVKPSTIRVVTPLVGNSETYIVQSYRQRGEGDVIFVEHVGRRGTTRLVLPAKVADVIARQRDALSTKSRRKAAKLLADERKLAGVEPFKRKAATAE
jgi:hypothetical protein